MKDRPLDSNGFCATCYPKDDKSADPAATVASSDSAANEVLRQIYQIATRLLAEPPDGDTGPLVWICTLIETNSSALTGSVKPATETSSQPKRLPDYLL